jgi:hypothetical protein
MTDTASVAPSGRLALFTFFAALYALGASGTVVDNADSMFFFGVALNLSRTADFAVAPEIEQTLSAQGSYDHLRGRDGRLYFSKGMSYSALLVPFVLTGELLERLANRKGKPGTMATQMLLATMAGPLLTAGQCLLMFEIVMALGFRHRTALLTALVAGLGTILWADSKANGAEPFHGLLITAAYYGAVRFARSRSAVWAFVVGASQALLLLSQPAMILLVVPVVTAYMTALAWRSRPVRRIQWIRWAVAYALPLGLGLAALAALNRVRYGNPATTGYEWLARAFEIPLYVGVYGLLFSAGKSIFVYSPPLILALRAWRPFVGRVGMVGTLPVALLSCFLAVYGHFTYWAGDGSWGPRYLVPLTGVLCVLLAAALEPALGRREVRLAPAMLALTVAGVAVQLVGVCTSTWLYFKLFIDAGVLLPDAGIAGWKSLLYDPQFSPVVGRAWVLVSGIRRACGFDSLTWVVSMGTGGQKAMKLAGYDELAPWPFLVWRTGTIPEWAVLGSILLLVLLIGMAGHRLHQIVTIWAREDGAAGSGPVSGQSHIKPILSTP